MRNDFRTDRTCNRGHCGGPFGCRRDRGHDVAGTKRTVEGARNVAVCACPSYGDKNFATNMTLPPVFLARSVAWARFSIPFSFLPVCAGGSISLLCCVAKRRNAGPTQKAGGKTQVYGRWLGNARMIAARIRGSGSENTSPTVRVQIPPHT